MFDFGPVVIDHGMPMDGEPMGELDILDGLRAMSMFKRDPGPLKPTDLNQEVKYALAENPHCLDMLYQEGFLDDSLVREMEQMIEDSVSAAAAMPQMVEHGISGLLVEPENVGALHEALISVDPTWGSEGPSQVVELGMNVHGQRVRRVCEDLLN